MPKEIKERADSLIAMHNAVINMGDEELYMDWITLGVPDESTLQDFYDIAEDIEAYNECKSLFKKLSEIDIRNNY